MTYAGTIPDQLVVKLPGLQRRRLEAALSQTELGDKATVSRATIARIERGEEARPSTLRRLADALGCTPVDLMRQPPPL